MKHIYIILFLLLVIGVSSCSEEQEELNRNDNKARMNRLRMCEIYINNYIDAMECRSI